MASTDRIADRRLALLSALESTPWAFDFYQALRRVESLHPELPRLGEALRASDEPVRLGQQVELSFAPSNVALVRPGPGGRPRISVRFLGLFGPQGPMPTHLTEFTRERERAYNDPTLARFADMFHHRLLLLFYRAWRQAQPTASRDRPTLDRFMVYLGSLVGTASPAFAGRDSISDESKRHFAGHLSRGVKSADSLASILSAYFDFPVVVRQFAARWMRLPVSEQTRLGLGGAALGQSAVAGSRVFDAQHHVELRLGPMSLADYESVLPPGGSHHKLRDWVRMFTCEEFFVHALLQLDATQVPALRLGSAERLGWTTWLGRRAADAGPTGDLSLALSAVAS